MQIQVYKLRLTTSQRDLVFLLDIIHSVLPGVHGNNASGIRKGYPEGFISMKYRTHRSIVTP